MFNWLRKNSPAENAAPKTDVTRAPISIAHSAMAEGEAFKNQGNANLANGKLDDAAECYRRAIERNPHYAEAYTNLGVVNQAKGNLNEAMELYRTATALKPDLLIAHQNLSMVLMMCGQTDAAEKSFRQVLTLSPEQPFALLNLGVIAAQRGDLPQAEALLHRAVELEPNVDTLFNLGNVLKDQRKLEDAAENYRRALEIKPDYYRAHNNLGMALQELGQLDDAVASFHTALDIKPDFALSYYNLGSALGEQGRFDEAIASYRKAIALSPDLLIAHQNLSTVLMMCGQADAAEESFQRVITLSPDHPLALQNLGILAAKRGDFPRAEAFLRRALELEPNVDTLFNLGNVLKDQRKLEEAAENYRQALKIKPDYYRAHNNLGMALQELGQLGDAVASFHRALHIKPDHALSYYNLGTVLGDLGQFDEAIASYRKALEVEPDLGTYSNLLFILNFTTHLPSYYLEQAHLFGQFVSKKVGKRYSSWKCTISPKRLRVGLVSGDLREHSVGHFLEGLIAHIDPARIELFGYPTCDEEDELTSRIRPYFAAWKPLFGLDDEAAARLIHDDGVHVLFDLSVHTAKNRLSVFAWKPAPIQVSWLGLPSTTGIAEMDYVLGDPHAIPTEHENHFSETVWRMPHSYLCLTVPASTIEVAPLPALTAGHVTFGSFNNLTKMTDEVVAVWARILQSVPNSLLLLKTNQLHNPVFCENTYKRFALHDIPRDRLILIGRLASSADHLAMYNRVDIALDTFPYPGVTTSVEALWMGVPVLSLRGDRFLSCTAGSIAHNAGLADWIAADKDDYVAKAIKFTSDLESLANLRANLRQQVITCPLFDAPRFAKDFEDTLWQMHGLQSKASSLRS